MEQTQYIENICTDFEKAQHPQDCFNLLTQMLKASKWDKISFSAVNIHTVSKSMSDAITRLTQNLPVEGAKSEKWYILSQLLYILTKVEDLDQKKIASSCLENLDLDDLRLSDYLKHQYTLESIPNVWHYTPIVNKLLKNMFQSSVDSTIPSIKKIANNINEKNAIELKSYLSYLNSDDINETKKTLLDKALSTYIESIKQPDVSENEPAPKSRFDLFKKGFKDFSKASIGVASQLSLEALKEQLDEIDDTMAQKFCREFKVLSSSSARRIMMLTFFEYKDYFSATTQELMDKDMQKICTSTVVFFLLSQGYQLSQDINILQDRALLTSGIMPAKSKSLAASQTTAVKAPSKNKI